MSKCEKCGHDPDQNRCPFCGADNQTLALFGDELLTICCQKDPFAEALKADAETPEGGE